MRAPCRQFGCIVGRVANRIAEGKFTLDGVAYTLATNNGPNCLHGGVDAYHTRIWSGTTVPGGVKLSLHSPDGDAGFPGALDVTATCVREAFTRALACRMGRCINPQARAVVCLRVPGPVRLTLQCCCFRYTLAAGGVLELVMEAALSSGTGATPVNLAQHSYFNLAGHGFAGLDGVTDSSAGKGDGKALEPVDGHRIILEADAYTPVDANLIPTGALQPVAGSTFDLTEASALGAWSAEGSSGGASGPAAGHLLGPKLRALEAASPDAAAAITAGFDHNFVLRRSSSSVSSSELSPSGLALAAVVAHERSGRTLTVETTAPGVQLYTGNFLDGSLRGKRGTSYGRHAGLCLETQHFPSSVDELSAVTAAFAAVGGATPIVRPGGAPYRHIVRYTFGTTAPAGASAVTDL